MNGEFKGDFGGGNGWMLESAFVKIAFQENRF